MKPGRGRRPAAEPPGRGGKAGIRERIWALLEARGVARFPRPIRDRIPNFVGAEAAAARAAALPEWRAARALKCNPDAPQRPVRLRALQDGKIVFMAVPRLARARCFLRLDPAKLGGRLAEASTIAGAAALGEPILPRQLPAIDLVVAGSVAVSRGGARLGKGGGYSDLEFALARALGRVGEDTPVLSTVHDLQVVRGAIPMTAHDVPLDLIVTPTRTIRVRRRRAKPAGLDRGALSAAQLAAMPPVRAALRRQPRAPSVSAAPPAGRAPGAPRSSGRRREV